jgi:predicted NBD/HSP70 family sugar kinase
MTSTRIDLGDIEDLIATLHVAGHDVRDLDAIGIAIPGVVNRESTAFEVVGSPGDYELGRRIYERYGVRVFVDNNANAAAVGCYVSQDEYDSVSFHTQQTGHLIGCHGIVVDGHLVKGRGNFAGEL